MDTYEQTKHLFFIPFITGGGIKNQGSPQSNSSSDLENSVHKGINGRDARRDAETPIAGEF